MQVTVDIKNEDDHEQVYKNSLPFNNCVYFPEFQISLKGSQTLPYWSKGNLLLIEFL